MCLEALAGSVLPDELRARGYQVTEVGTAQRIILTALSRSSSSVPVASLSWQQPSDHADHIEGLACRHRHYDGLALREPDEPRRIAP